ncbi:hypothetical protein [Halorussus sp. MSC15.2]|uniref:hypothetical protein n=1 Tax=Halorussus sp. MSC15.2 TaxID=2283638 RepID=UPI0013D6B55F|nr:hypothetical protein [Halorussus sp. MSC15.2]NEU59253.1 hypothetical protein [Halorussus sp. MSC15.2]
MSSSNAASETADRSGNDLAGRVSTLAETVGPKLARHAGSGNLAAASGVVSLLRAARTFLKGNRKRGVRQLLGGLFWVGVSLAQRRSGGSGDSDGPGRSRERRSGTDVSEVADISPDVEDAVEPGGHETDHATGESVVDTTDADIEESDTAPEVGASPDVAGDVDDEDVNQRDVAESAPIEDAAETGDEDETESQSDGGTESDAESQAGTESDSVTESESGSEDETGTASRGDSEDEEAATEADERVETTSGE